MVEEQKRFLYLLFKESDSIFHKDNDFLETKVLSCGTNRKDGVAIFGRFVKRCYNKYVVNGGITTEELRKTLMIMMSEKLNCTYKVFERTKKGIDSGFYDEEIENLEKELEIEKLDIDFDF